MYWKLLTLFLAWSNIFFATGETPAPGNVTDPITVAYSYAQLVSTLTDRALWLFFLGLILAIAWIMDRRKDRQLAEYRKWERENAERIATLIESNQTCLDHLTDELKDLRKLLIERRLDR